MCPVGSAVQRRLEMRFLPDDQSRLAGRRVEAGRSRPSCRCRSSARSPRGDHSLAGDPPRPEGQSHADHATRAVSCVDVPLPEVCPVNVLQRSTSSCQLCYIFATSFAPSDHRNSQMTVTGSCCLFSRYLGVGCHEDLRRRDALGSLGAIAGCFRARFTFEPALGYGPWRAARACRREDQKSRSSKARPVCEILYHAGEYGSSGVPKHPREYPHSDTARRFASWADVLSLMWGVAFIIGASATWSRALPMCGRYACGPSRGASLLDRPVAFGQTVRAFGDQTHVADFREIVDGECAMMYA